MSPPQFFLGETSEPDEKTDQSFINSRTVKMKLGFILCIVLLLHTSNTNSLANEIENRGFIVDFDYKCMLCKWTAQLLIKYHGEGFKPERLFFLISKLCTFFGHMDSVS